MIRKRPSWKRPLTGVRPAWWRPVHLQKLPTGLTRLWSEQKAMRREVEAQYLRLMGKPMSSRAWRRVRKAMKRSFVGHVDSQAARFLSKVRWNDA